LKKLLLGAIIILFGQVSLAADLYVHAAAGGTNSGADWTNACPGFTGACAISSLSRPSKVCVAEGSYGSIDLNKANSGTSLISIVRAIDSSRDPADTHTCRTAAGWNDSFGDGQASFDAVFFTTDFWLLDGVVRNESNPPFSWNAETRTEYGFRISLIFSNDAVNGNCAEEVTIKYADIGKEYSTTYNTPTNRGIIHLGTPPCKNWLVQRVFIHNTFESIQLAGTDGFTLEYSWLGLAWSKEIIRGQNTARNVILRYNWFENGCRNDGSGGDVCTAEIALFANVGAEDDFEGFQAYGNVLYKTLVQHNADGCISVSGTDAKVFNNTIVHYGSTGTCQITTLTGGGSEVRNNIWFLPNGITSGCSNADTCSDSSAYTSSPPFVDVGARNVHLTGALAGFALSSPYNVDMDSGIRGADSTFDRGAFEFLTGGAGAIASLSSSALTPCSGQNARPGSATVCSTTLTLQNTGDAVLTITSITLSAALPFAQSNDCTATLAAGISCTITLTFTPGNGRRSYTTDAHSRYDRQRPNLHARRDGADDPCIDGGTVTFTKSSIALVGMPQ